MTISYNSAAQPTWQIIYPPSAAAQLIGKPLAAARVFTYSSLNHAEEKTTYQSNEGTPPPALPNPVVANAIGQVTIYWALDDQDIQDLYFVQIRGPEGDDTVYYEYDNFDGSSFVGSDSPSTRVDFNFVRNPQFTWNRFKQTYNLQNLSSTVTSGTYVGDDWIFTKNNSSTNETIAIIPFTAGQTVVPNNPINYLSWNIVSPGSGETFKNIYQKYKSAQTLSGQTVTFQFWASSSTSATIQINVRQYFGTGGSPSSDVVTPFPSAFHLIPGMTFYSSTLTIPSISGKSLGTNGDDLIQLEIALPLNAAGGTNMNVTNIQLELGNTANTFQYETPNDQRTRLDPDWFGTPTGDIKFSAGSEASLPGWLPLDDGTIGNIASGATTYINEDAYALYSYLWNNFSNTQCPVSTGRGANALADFNANKTINLPLTMCRVMGNAGTGSGLTARVNGVTGGAETAALTGSNMAQHTHGAGGGVPGTQFVVTTPGGASSPIGGGGSVNVDEETLTDTGTGLNSTGSAFSIMNPFSFINMFIKL